MNTSYIRFHMTYDDPVWGTHAFHSGTTHLVRVTRNCLRKAVFEWVGYPHLPFDLERVKRSYPIAAFAQLPNSGDDFFSQLHRVSPLPKDIEVES